MTTQEYEQEITKIFNAHKRHERLSESISMLHASVLRMSSAMSGMPGSHDPKRFEKEMEKYVDMKALAANILFQRAEFDSFFSTLTSKQQDVVSFRCEKNMGWKEISHKLDISEKKARTLFENVGVQLELLTIIQPT